MALANDQMPPASCIGSVQVPDLSSPRPYAVDEFNKAILGEETCLEGGLVKNIAMSHSSPLFGPSSTNSNAFLLMTPGYQPEEAHSFIDFKSGYGAVMHSCESLLSFEQNEQASQNSFSKTNSHKDEYSMVGGNFSQNYQRNQVAPKCGSDPRLLEKFNCFQTASNFSSITNATTKEGPRQGDGTYGWLYTDAALVADGNQGSGTHQSLFHKRAREEETSPAIKKNSTNANKKAKPNSSSPKDPQSIAAKNRRERISERLKILQELVPNGSKVDLVTMLEKAISYVKFLQLQVKVLATDEFWPAQGGKAPDISQVKEAIDDILSSQKDRNSSS